MLRLLSWVSGSTLLATSACGNTRVEREPEVDSGQTPDSGPIAPPAQASLFFVIGPPRVAGPGCAISGNYLANIGGPPRAAASDPGPREVDGVGDARISCRVSGSTSFEVSGSADKGAVSFRLLEGRIGPVDGTGTMAVGGPGTAGKLLTSGADGCTLGVSRAPFQVASGAIWAEFDCPVVTTPADPGSTCSARGEFVFENCER
jgi:hypothetical protein